MDHKITINALKYSDPIPYDLLLLADPSIGSIEDYLNRGQCFLAKEYDRVIGVYVLLKTKPFTMELMNIAVVEDKQNQGIGRLLTLDSINRARQLGAKTLEVGTGNSSLSQLGLYQKCGFRIIGVDMDYFTKNYKEKIIENGIECRDMIRMRLELIGM